MARITTDRLSYVSARRCGRRSAQVAGRQSSVDFGRTAWDTAHWQYASGDRSQNWQAPSYGRKISGQFPPICGGEEDSEVGRAMDSQLMGPKRENSRFVHACTNHVQRENNTGRATWALIPFAFTVHRACLPPTRERGSWHPNQSCRAENVESACAGKG